MAKFEDMTKAQQRVAIAKDVLEWLDVYGVVRGHYLVANFKHRTLAAVSGDCKVCALGATFLSSIRLGNQYPESKITMASKQAMQLQVSRWFDFKQVVLIEAAFERYRTIHGMQDHPDDYGDGLDGRDLLRLIMENIIANKGTFDPSFEVTCVQGDA